MSSLAKVGFISSAFEISSNGAKTVFNGQTINNVLQTTAIYSSFGALSEIGGKFGNTLFDNEQSTIKFFESFNEPEMLKYNISLTTSKQYYRSIFNSNFYTGAYTSGSLGFLNTFGINFSNTTINKKAQDDEWKAEE